MNNRMFAYCTVTALALGGCSAGGATPAAITAPAAVTAQSTAQTVNTKTTESFTLPTQDTTRPKKYVIAVPGDVTKVSRYYRRIY